MRFARWSLGEITDDEYADALAAEGEDEDSPSIQMLRNSPRRVPLTEELCLVPLEYLRAPAWAKAPYPPLVATIVEKFDPRLLGVFTVSKRSDTEFVVIDGMVRWEVLQQLVQPQAPCFVLSGLTEKREAEIRVEMLMGDPKGGTYVIERTKEARGSMRERPYRDAQGRPTETAPYSVEHSQDELGDHHWFVTDEHGDWIGDSLPTRELAAEEVQRLNRERRVT